jgi:hypothetical protein
MSIGALDAGVAFAMDIDEILKGAQPDKIPDEWVGSPTRSAKGYRLDDPNGQNTVRFFKGDAKDPDPSKHNPYVIVISNGMLVGPEGKRVPSENVVD